MYLFLFDIFWNKPLPPLFCSVAVPLAHSFPDLACFSFPLPPSSLYPSFSPPLVTITLYFLNPSYLAQPPTGLVSLIFFPIFPSNSVWNERILASCMEQMWFHASTNHRQLQANHSLKHSRENTDTSCSTGDIYKVQKLYGALIFLELNPGQIIIKKVMSKQKMNFFSFI